MSLIRKYLSAGVMENGVVKPTKVGTPQGGKWKPKPHIKSYQKLKRELKQLTKRSWSINLDERIKKINYLIRGWVNYFR